jgi:hypothetical protein
MTRDDFPVGGSPDAVAKWFGFASAAELEASHERYAEEMTAAATAEELAEADLEADYDAEAAEYDVEPEAGL